MNNSLYELNVKYQLALESLEIDENGEIINFDQVEEIQDELKEKAVQIGLFLKNRIAFQNQLKEEKKNISEKISREEKLINRLKNYVADSLQFAGIPKIEDSKIKLSFRKSVEVIAPDVDLLPEEFKRTRTEISPDKMAIKKAIQSGHDVTGAELIEKQNIQIK